MKDDRRPSTPPTHEAPDYVRLFPTQRWSIGEGIATTAEALVWSSRVPIHPHVFGRNKGPGGLGQGVGWGSHLEEADHQNLGSAQNIIDKVTGTRKP